MVKTRSRGDLMKNKSSLIFYICMVALPLTQICIFFIAVNFNSILLAFKSYTSDGEYIFVGLDNFKTFFRELFGEKSAAMRMRLTNSLLLYAVGLIVGVPLNIIFAYLIYKKVPCAAFFNVILFLPQILSSIIMSIMFRYFMEKALPVIAELLNVTNLPSFFVDISSAFPTILIYNVWAGFGGQIIVYISTMSRIPGELVEVGKIEGMNLWQEFRYLTFPMIYSTISTYLVIATSAIFVNQASLFNFYGNEAPAYTQTFGYYLFVTVLKSDGYDAYPIAASMGLCFTAVSIPLVYFVSWLLNRYNPEVET